LCRAITGEGFTKRQLFTDDDDVPYAYMRLRLFNGINLAIDKPDLLDRSLIVAVERIADNNRKDEKTIWQQFENERALLLGSIFDRLSGAIREYDNVQFSTLP